MTKSDNDDEFTVGYAKPPAEHRFKKGRSGNPKGRPKKEKKQPEPPKFRDGMLGSFLEREAFRTLQLHENGNPVEMTAAEAILRSIMLDGVKGNRLAKKYALETLRQEEKEALERSSESYLFWMKTKLEGEAEIARCEKQGIEPPRLYPHPDDILLDETKIKAHIVGPLNADQAIPFERGALVRDLFLAITIFEEKHGKATTFELNGHTGKGGVFVAQVINDSLPPSFQKGDAVITIDVLGLQSLTKKQLGKRLNALRAQIADMPETVAERIATRERAIIAVDILGGALETVAAEMAEKQGSGKPGSTRSTKKTA